MCLCVSLCVHINGPGSFCRLLPMDTLTLDTLTYAVSGFIVYKTELSILHKTVTKAKRSSICTGHWSGSSTQVGVTTEALSQV